MPFKVHHEVCAQIFWIIFENEVKNVYLQLEIVFSAHNIKQLAAE